MSPARSGHDAPHGGAQRDVDVSQADEKASEMEPTPSSNRTRGHRTPNRRWVRELSTREDPAIQCRGTGELLPDGTVVLRETDINRMGLRTLRRWLTQHSLDPMHPIGLVPDLPRPHGTEVDEDDDVH